MADVKTTKNIKDEINVEDDKEKRWTIPRDGELRIEVGHTNSLQLILVSGDAEIYGSELVPDVKYTLKPGYCCAIHSWTGGVIISKSIPLEIVEEQSIDQFCSSSNKDLIYTAQESPMLHYLNTHYFIKNLRDKSLEEDRLGPRVLICGATDTGKSTLCQILLNYAVRNGNQCIYVDMDCGQNSLTIQGTISAAYIDKQITDLLDNIYLQDSFSITEKYSQISCPLVYFVGDTSLDKCYDNYLHYSSLMATNVLKQLESSKRLKRSGCIINTCGYIVGNGLSCIEHIIKEFQVNVVLVLDNERLYTQLNQLEGVYSVLLPKSSGVVEKGTPYRKYRRHQSLKNYFYGIDGNYAPNIIKVPFENVHLYSLASLNLLDSCLPLGFSGNDNTSTNKIHTRLVSPNDDMVNHVMAIINAEDDNQLSESYVLGFVVVLKVDSIKKRIKLLSPGGDLPTKYLLYSPSIIYNNITL